MRFSMPTRQDLYKFTQNRLKFGACCILCHRKGSRVRDLCDGCESVLVPRVCSEDGGGCSYLCLACGRPCIGEQLWAGTGLSGSGSDFQAQSLSGTDSYCSLCNHDTHPFSRIVAPYRYEFPLDGVIARLKYGQRRQLARMLGSLLAKSVLVDVQLLPDIVLPVPLHPRRQRSRGFNQAADIARWCAHELGVVYQPVAASRGVDTDSLAGMSRVARQHAILGAFRASDSVFSKRVAIVDDVLTTGSTARELARELYDTGASSVELWVLARTSSER